MFAKTARNVPKRCKKPRNGLAFAGRKRAAAAEKPVRRVFFQPSRTVPAVTGDASV